MWRYTHQHYIPVVLGGSLILILRERNRQHDPCLIPLWLDRMLMVAGACLLLTAVLQRSYGIAALAAFVVVGAIILRFRRDSSVGRFWGVWLFLIFLLRPPAQIDILAMHFLQTLCVKRGSLLLDAANVLHVRLGNTIWASGKVYFVDEAFTGTGLIFSLIALSAWLAVLNRRTVLHSLLLFFSSAFWAWSVYSLWVFVVVLVDQKFHIDLQKRSLTLFAESMVYVFALTMIFCTDFGVACFPSRSLRYHVFGRPEITEETLRSLENPKANCLFNLVITAAFFLLLIAQCFVFSRSDMRGEIYSLRFQRSDLPEGISGWKQIDFDTVQRSPSDMRGELSAMWVYEKNGQQVYVTVDYPFEAWHELPECYVVKGDSVSRRTILNSADFPNRVVTVDLETADGFQGSLAFTLFRENGQLVEPPIDGTQGIQKTVRKVASSLLSTTRNQAVQIQVLHVGATGSDKGFRDEVGKLLTEASLELAKKVKTSAEKDQRNE